MDGRPSRKLLLLIIAAIPAVMVVTAVLPVLFRWYGVVTSVAVVGLLAGILVALHRLIDEVRGLREDLTASERDLEV